MRENGVALMPYHCADGWIYEAHLESGDGRMVSDDNAAAASQRQTHRGLQQVSHLAGSGIAHSDARPSGQLLKSAH